MSEHTIQSLTEECSRYLQQWYPTLQFRHSDLYGFISGAWPTESDAAELGDEFEQAIRRQESESNS